MNSLDVLLLMLIGAGFLAGTAMGLVRIVWPAAAAVALWLTLGLADDVAILLKPYVDPTWVVPLSYLVVVLVAVLLLAAVVRGIHVFIRLLFLGWVNRLAGGAAGLILGALIGGAAVMAVELLPFPEVKELLQGSRLAEPLKLLVGLGVRRLQELLAQGS